MLTSLRACAPVCARAAGARARNAPRARPSCAPAGRLLKSGLALRAPARSAPSASGYAISKIVVATATRPSTNAMSAMDDGHTMLYEMTHDPVMAGGMVMGASSALALANPALHHTLTAPLPAMLGVAVPMIDLASTAMLLMVALQAGLASVDMHYAAMGTTKANLDNAAMKHGVCSLALMGAYALQINTHPTTALFAAFFGMMALWARKASASMDGTVATPAFALNALTVEGIMAIMMGFTMLFTTMDMMAMLFGPMGVSLPRIVVEAPWEVMVPTLLMGLGASRLHAGMHAPTRRDFTAAAASSGVVTGIVLVMHLLGRASMQAVGFVMCIPATMAVWAYMTAIRMSG